ncbi:MAG: aminotransferase class III-fold pyridoxal phosphate-dependent enzyme, partial [Armatimonadetes bacterium]|nr:aminotransferase class III-fold pyridoxal phosphate-dependent enzyme [Armatimonadota bacterium]
MSTQRSYDKSMELYRRAVELIPGGSQTNSKRPTAFALGAFPIYAQDAAGARVQDVDGNWYIDYILGLGPITLGYCYPAIDDAVREQLDRGIIYGLLSPKEVEAAEAICDMVPCAEMVRFLKGGSEVTSAAARIARGYTGRDLILNCGYRGWADGWAAEARAGQGGVPACVGEAIIGLPRYDLDALAGLLDEHEGEVAAVFMDAVTY